jgi:hypothetical protein
MIDDVFFLCFSKRSKKAPSKFACQLSILKMMQSLVKLFSIETPTTKNRRRVCTARDEREREVSSMRLATAREESDSFFFWGRFIPKNLHLRWIDF